MKLTQIADLTANFAVAVQNSGQSRELKSRSFIAVVDAAKKQEIGNCADKERELRFENFPEVRFVFDDTVDAESRKVLVCKIDGLGHILIGNAKRESTAVGQSIPSSDILIFEVFPAEFYGRRYIPGNGMTSVTKPFAGRCTAVQSIDFNMKST